MMLDFSNKRSPAFMGHALAYNMNNGTDEQVTRGMASESITECLDSKRQKIVPIGEYYYADACTLCLCSNAESMCKQISCAPPEKCDGYIKKDPMHCCDVCVPAVVVERPNDQSGLNMKLGALTVALFLVISLVLFTLHRMRRKRLLVTLRRLQTFRHRNSSCSHNGDVHDYRHSIEVTDSGLFSTSIPGMLSASDRAAVIAEGPPPYNAAVTLPRPPEALARAPPRCTAPAEPPPTYRQAVQQDVTTIRRCTSQNGHRPSSIGAGRHSRTSDYPDDDEEDVEVRSTTTYSSSNSSSSSSMSSLSSSRDSLNAVDGADLDGDEDCCSCSQCDSGLSEERGSLSSNEIRPRSEMLLANSSSYHVILGQASSHQLLRQTSPQPQQQSSSAATVERDERRQCHSRQENINNNGGEGCSNGNNGGGERKKENRGKLCKKKLKKLMMKAKRKAKKGKRTGDEDRSGNVASNNIEGECSRRSPSNRPTVNFLEHPESMEAMPVTSV